MPSRAATHRGLLPYAFLGLAVLGATGALGWTARSVVRRAWSHTLPRASLELAAVSPDGSRMVVVERPSGRAFERDDAGERALDPWVAGVARLGPTGAYVVGYDLWGRPAGAWSGGQAACEEPPSTGAPWSLPTWRPDGRALLRQTSAGLVADGPDGCRRLGTRATTAAFVGPAVATTDGRDVWLDDRPVWAGSHVRLLMAAGAAWVQADEGFGEITAGGVELRETRPGLARPLEMARGVCLVDTSDGFVQLTDPPPWGARCWRPGDPTPRDVGRGGRVLDVDVWVDLATHTLHDGATAEVRRLPGGFPLGPSTRRLADGRLRTFRMEGYAELGIDDQVREVTWAAPSRVGCGECGEPTWREPASLD